MSGDVIVIGGGLSGLAASVELALAGRHVILLERSPKLGGRCFSYREPVTGDIVDNGQHVLLGAYLHTLRYLRNIESERHVQRGRITAPSLFKAGRGISAFDLRPWLGSIPIPRGMLEYAHLTLGDKLNLFRIGAAMRSKAELTADLTVEEWLDAHGQSSNAKKSLWYPLAVSIMNELPEKASAKHFVESLRAAFSGIPRDAEILVPSVGQTELYVDGALALLRRKSCEVILNEEVKRIEVEGERVKSAELSGGGKVSGEACICAVPPFALEKILHEHVLITTDGGLSARVPAMEYSPIVSVYLWFDSRVMSVPMLGLIERNIQWLFDRTSFIDGAESSGFCISGVASAAYDLAEKTKEEIVAIALKEICEAYPEAKGFIPVHSLVLKEKRATISLTPEAERHRPITRTTVKNLFIAGDWTQTGLPATIEGALKSGQAAASLVLNRT